MKTKLPDHTTGLSVPARLAPPNCAVGPARKANTLQCLLLLYGLLFALPVAGQWQQTKGPQGGHVRSLMLNSTTNTLFAGTNGGVYKSTDNGTNWTQAGLATTDVVSLVLNSTTNTLFAGTNGGGVYRSTDNGANWTAVNNGLANLHVLSLLLNSTNNTLFAGTNGEGVYKSIDNGANWTAVNTGLANKYVLSLVLNSTTNTLFAGTDGGVYRFTDNGANWTEVSNGLVDAFVWGLVLNTTTNTLFAGMDGGGVYKSTDNGTNWTQAGLATTTIISLALNSATNTLFAGTGGGGVYRSTDNGTNWTPVNTGLTNTIVLSLVLNSITNTLFAGTDGGGVYKSTDNGANWTPVNNGLANTTVFSMVLNGTTNTLFAGTDDGGIYRSTDNGTNWTLVNTGLATTTVMSLALNSPANTLFAGTSGAGIYKSTDNGANWTPANAGLTSMYVWSIVLNSTTNTLFAGTDGGIYKSTDNGANWTAVNTGLSSTYVLSLALNSTTNTLFAGTYGEGVYRSTDNGASWTPVNTGLANVYVRSMALNSTTNTLFAGTFEGVYRSTDNGASWTPVNTGLGNTYASSLALNSTTNTLFAGTFGGVYRSSNNGANWTPVNTGLGSSTVWSIVLNSTTNTLFAGTGGGGVWVGVFPALLDRTPAHNATGQESTSKLKLVFTKAVQKGTGTISLSYNGGAGQTIDVTGSGVVIAGAEVTITPPSPLPPSATIAVTIPSTAFVDAIGDAFAGTTGSAGAAPWNFTVKADGEKPSIGAPSVSKAGAGYQVSFSVGDNSGKLGEVRYRYKATSKGTSQYTAYAALPLPATVPANLQLLIPAEVENDPLGFEYEITAKDATGNEEVKAFNYAWSNKVVTIPYASYGGGAENYQLIALPLKLSAADQTVKSVLEDDLGGYDREKWRLFGFRNGSIGKTGLIEYGSGLTNLELGKGYFLIIKEGGKRLDTPDGEVADVSSSKSFTINLVKGWNLIGNPYPFNVAWDDVKGNNPDVTQLLVFNKKLVNGVTGTNARIDAYRGAFVFARNATTITIPCEKKPLVNGREGFEDKENTTAPLALSTDDGGWELPLILRAGNQTSDFGGIGMRREASDGHDAFDFVTPPRLLEWLEVNFYHSENAVSFSKDVVPLSEGKIWDFTVGSNYQEAHLTLEWGNQLPKNLSQGLWLYDPEAHLLMNMQQQSSYRFGNSPNRSLQIIYGSNAFLAERVKPRKMGMGVSYPNPFTEKTTIPFGLAQTSGQDYAVALEVYDLRGRRVGSLLEGEYKAGLYQASWDGTDAEGRKMPAGMYIIQLKVHTREGTRVFQQKTLLGK